MKQLIPPGKSLKYYGLLSWVVPGVIAVLSCAIIFVGFVSYSIHAEQKRLESALIEKSMLAARRVSAELLLGERGASDSVLKLLRDELDLSYARVLDASPCPDADYCFVAEPNAVSITRKIPAISDRYLTTSLPAPALTGLLSLNTLIWATLPVLLMFLIGVVLQRYIFRRYILNPIHALVETSTGSREARAFWPSEIQRISAQLAESFQLREQKVFEQIASGVIHDLRTLIHAPLGAIDLVDEVVENPEKRARRLESLKTICSQQLPKMRGIIDQTLDGSREVRLETTSGNIKETVQSSLRTLDPLIKQSKVRVALECALSDLVVAHDKIQLERAVTNLVKNAVEACQERPLEQREVRVTLADAHGTIALTVEDSGPGLRLEAGKTFKPLKSTKTHGTGLGLLVTRKIIEAHGGTLATEKSLQLGGAQFVVNLPAGGAP